MEGSRGKGNTRKIINIYISHIRGLNILLMFIGTRDKRCKSSVKIVNWKTNLERMNNLKNKVGLKKIWYMLKKS